MWLYARTSCHSQDYLQATPKISDNQSRFVKWANAYLEIKGESSETIRHTPETVKT